MIASQIESLPQQPAGPELFQGPWAKKGKKDGLGLFAKLLSGLAKNLGNGPSASRIIPEDAAASASAAEGGETPDGKPLQKNNGQKLLKAGAGFSRVRGDAASGAEDAAGRARDTASKKGAAGSREGESGETLYLLSRAETPVKLRTQDAPARTKPSAGEGEALETGLLVEGGGALAEEGEDPAVSGSFPRKAVFSGSESPFSEKAAARESQARGEVPEGAEAFSGESFRSAEIDSGSGFARSGSAKTGKTETETETKRPASARKADRRRERPAVFETRDLRSGQEAGAANLKESAFSGEKRLPGQEIDLSVELRSEGRGRESASTGGEKTLSQAFEDILSRELHQNLNGDIVRHASVALRDGGEGLIRLSLKPDTLGNVKIRLEMAENKITGHIVVESDEALRAFQREIGSLEQAFKDSGFDGADLSMSLASGNPGADQQREGGETVPYFPESFAVEQAASRYDALTEKTDVLFAMGSANGLMPGNGRISVNLLI